MIQNFLLKTIFPKKSQGESLVSWFVSVMLTFGYHLHEQNKGCILAFFHPNQVGSKKTLSVASYSQLASHL